MKIAWVGPLPPNASGIADYSADLLPAVAAIVPTTAFTTEPAWAPERPVPGLTVRPASELEEALRKDPALVPVFHQGNNGHHRLVHDLAMEIPGVLVLHDVVQHHGVLDRFGPSGAWEGYGEVLAEQYGPAGRDLAAMRSAGRASDLELFLFPLSGSLIRRSLVTVVHSRYARELARHECPTGVFTVIPHHSGVPPATLPLEPEDVRARLRVRPGTFLIGSFGYITAPKQGETLLEAVAQLAGAGAGRVDADVVFVGSDEMRGELSLRAAELGIPGRVHFAGYLDRPSFYSYLAAVDVVVALRYPSAGETSGTLSRALSLGKCLVVGDYANFAELPQDAVVHVSIHQDPAGELARALRRLIDRPSLRKAIGERAGRLAAAELSVARCARLYVEAAASAAYLAGAGLPTALTPTTPAPAPVTAAEP